MDYMRLDGITTVRDQLIVAMQRSHLSGVVILQISQFWTSTTLSWRTEDAGAGRRVDYCPCMDADFSASQSISAKNDEDTSLVDGRISNAKASMLCKKNMRCEQSTTNNFYFFIFLSNAQENCTSYILERNKKPYKKEILLGKSLKAPTQKPEGNYKLEP